MNIGGEVIGLFVTIIGSAFGITAYVSQKFAELSTNMVHVLKRIDALEDDVDAIERRPRAAKINKKKPVATRRARGR